MLYLRYKNKIFVIRYILIYRNPVDKICDTLILIMLKKIRNQEY